MLSRILKQVSPTKLPNKAPSQISRNYIGLMGLPKTQIIEEGQLNEPGKLNALRYKISQKDVKILPNLVNLYQNLGGYHTSSREKLIMEKMILQTKMLNKDINTLNAEELQAWMEISLPLNIEKATYLFPRLINRFSDLLIRELSENNAGFVKVGDRYQVKRKYIEGRTFARIIGTIMQVERKKHGAVLAQILPNIDQYIRKEKDNISFDDMTLILSSLLNHFGPSDLHINYFQHSLPLARITNGYTMCLVVKMLCDLKSMPKTHGLPQSVEEFREAMSFIHLQIKNISSFKAPFMPVALSKIGQPLTHIWNDIPEDILKVYMECVKANYTLQHLNEIVKITKISQNFKFLPNFTSLEKELLELPENTFSQDDLKKLIILTALEINLQKKGIMRTSPDLKDALIRELRFAHKTDDSFPGVKDELDTIFEFFIDEFKEFKKNKLNVQNLSSA